MQPKHFQKVVPGKKKSERAYLCSKSIIPAFHGTNTSSKSKTINDHRLIDRVEYKQGDTGRQLCQLINVDVLLQSPVPFQLPSSFSGIPAAGCVYIHTRDHGEPFLTANNNGQEQE